jgi:hypothetical protein|nr:PorV/PorQ family protein [Candidatus Krumholzibacteria bacterium]
MKKTGLATLIVVWALVMGGAQTSWAQTKVGTTIGTFMRIEPSARGAALGNAGSALPGGVEAIYYNSGAIGRIETATVQYSHNQWYADIGYDYAAFATPIGGVGNIFASVTSLGSGDIQVRTVDQPLGAGVFYDVSNVALSVGFGRRITDRFSAGVQANYLNERVWNTSSKVLTFNLGTIYRLSEGGALLGFCLSNLSTQGRYTGSDLDIQYDDDPDTYGDNSALPATQSTDSFPLPGLVRLGISVPYVVSENSSFLFLVEGLHPNDNSESLNLGAEWKLQQLLSLRMGYQTLFQTDSELGLTFGFGVEGDLGDNRYLVNYAWAGHEYLESTHRLTLVIEF